MSNALLQAMLDMVQAEWAKPEVVWRTARIEGKDLQFLETECKKVVAFDPKGWRKEMFERYRAGKAEWEVRECEHGRVMVIYDNPTQQVPWNIWGRILRLYGTKHRVYLLAHPALRTFPKGPIQPNHINGGYNYPCNVEAVMVYRAEDATRVLIHELQHAHCLDCQDDSLDCQEAETEAWAELLYHAILSEGNKSTFHRRIKEQAAWMMAQNEEVRRHMKTPTDFPYRYTIAKEEVWARWGLTKGVRPSTSAAPRQSLRLTVPKDPDNFFQTIQ